MEFMLIALSVNLTGFEFVLVALSVNPWGLELMLVAHNSPGRPAWAWPTGTHKGQGGQQGPSPQGDI